MGRSLTAADVFAAAKPNLARTSLLFGSDLMGQRAKLVHQIDGSASEAAQEELAQRISEIDAELAAAIEESGLEFVFQSMGRGRWRALVAAFPPTDEEKAGGAQWNIDEFPFHAMAASLIEPEMSAEDLKKLNDEVLTFEQYSQLWGACLTANMGGDITRPESLAARATPANGRPKSTPPSDSESVEVS